MDDLISRRAAIDEIKALYEWHDTVTEDRVIDHLTRLSFTQAEIIFCKDCYYYHTHDHRCKRWNHGARVTDFCSRAEEKGAQDE